MTYKTARLSVYIYIYTYVKHVCMRTIIFVMHVSFIIQSVELFIYFSKI